MAYTELKLNYLLETKSLIREAAVAKGAEISESDTFRSYAEKIAAINGGSSGGGTLPAGIYLSAPSERVPNTYRGKRFWFNGELYATSTNVAGAGYLTRIYKWNGSSWILLLSATGSYGISDAKIDSASWKGLEYNGKFHFFDARHHAVFDGTTLTVMNDLPNDNSNINIYQNKLISFSYDAFALYEWNESDDTWTTIATFSEHPSKCAVVSNELYFQESNKLYKYIDGALMEIGTLLKTSMSEFFAMNGNLYYMYRQSTRTEWYKHNIATNESAKLGESSGFALIYCQFDENELSFCGITANGNNNCAPHFIVNIIE